MTVNTQDTLSGFQEFFLQPIIKDRYNTNKHDSANTNGHIFITNVLELYLKAKLDFRSNHSNCVGLEMSLRPIHFSSYVLNALGVKIRKDI